MEEENAVELAVRAAVNYIALNMDAADSYQNRQVLKVARIIGIEAGNQKLTVPDKVK